LCYLAGSANRHFQNAIFVAPPTATIRSPPFLSTRKIRRRKLTAFAGLSLIPQAFAAARIIPIIPSISA
jgi:hypothetical protein